MIAISTSVQTVIPGPYTSINQWAGISLVPSFRNKVLHNRGSKVENNMAITNLNYRGFWKVNLSTEIFTICLF